MSRSRISDGDLSLGSDLIWKYAGPQILQNWWLAVWAGQTQAAGDHLTVSGLHHYLGVYSYIGFASLACQMIRGIFLLLGMLNASKLLHSNLVGNVSAERPTAASMPQQAGCRSAVCWVHDCSLQNAAQRRNCSRVAPL